MSISADVRRWPGAPPIHTVIDGLPTCHRRHPGADPAAIPTLLIHGIACSSEAFGPLLMRWAADREARSALAPDMPGYGRSTGPRHALDIAALANWQARFLDAMAVPRVHVIGHSMGCQVALALARQAPARVASCVLIGPTTGDQYEGLARYAAGLVADSVVESVAWNWTLRRMLWQMGAPRYVATMRHMLRDHPIACADAVGCPVLVLRGHLDCIIREDVARRLADALPRGSFQRLEIGSHALQFNYPSELWAVCRPFLAAADRPLVP